MYYDHKSSSFLAARFVVDRLPIEPRRARASQPWDLRRYRPGGSAAENEKVWHYQPKLSVIELGYAIPAATRESGLGD